MAGVYQYTPAPAPRNNGLALTSGILGISGWVINFVLICFNLTVGLLTLGIGSICVSIAQPLVWIIWLLGIIFGHVGIGQINRTGEGGKGWATAGLILGYLGIFTTIVLVILLVLSVAGILTIPFLTGTFDQIIQNLPSY